MTNQTTASQNGEVVEASRDLTVQSRAREPRFGLARLLMHTHHLMPGWWSVRRDMYLRNFWKQSDHLSGALYTMIAKMIAIPFEIIPVDQSDESSLSQAEERRLSLLNGAEFGNGWNVFYSKFIEDLLSQDNGAFAEIIGPGRADGPLTGAPVSVAHLDAGRCQRTGEVEFPILYYDSDGRVYKMHYTRVAFTAQMPSPIQNMFGVGYCAISRAVNVAQTLIDILMYKQEKLGSRPHRGVIITKGGLDPDDMVAAFRAAANELDTRGQSRYSNVIVTGDRSIQDADASLLELSELPDGFDEETSVTLGMATIALAFGVDARELFPAMTSGATRADALLSHLKQRGKGPGQIIQSVESLLNFKYLPPHLKIVFQHQDDAEDRQRAEISHVRAERRQRDLQTQVTTERAERQKMVVDGEITDEQFERMEWEDGRLLDGCSILSSFYSTDKTISEALDLGVENPDDTSKHTSEEILPLISSQRSKINQMTAETQRHETRLKLSQSSFALDALERLYQESEPSDGDENNTLMRMRSERTRREDLMNPNDGVELDDRDTLRPSQDDSEVIKERLMNIADRIENEYLD